MGFQTWKQAISPKRMLNFVALVMWDVIKEGVELQITFEIPKTEKAFERIFLSSLLLLLLSVGTSSGVLWSSQLY